MDMARICITAKLVLVAPNVYYYLECYIISYES